MLDLLTIGDIKLDTFIVIPDASVMCTLKDNACKLCIDYGAKIPVDDAVSHIAGSAPNVAVGIARMGKSSAVASCMGDDATHALALAFLKEQRVATRYVRAEAGRSSSFAAVLNFRGESTQLAVHRDTDYRLPSPLPKTAWLHVSELGKGYERLYRDVLGWVKRGSETRISLNPGAVQLRERSSALSALIAASEVLFVNRREACEFLTLPFTTPMAILLKKIYTHGADNVVVTDGKDGAYAYDGNVMRFAPAFPGTRVEATGAGDAFVTGYLGALLHGKTADDALRWGSVNAASVIGTIGPTDGLLTHKIIATRLAKRPSYRTRTL